MKSKKKKSKGAVSVAYDATRTFRTITYIAKGNISGYAKHKVNQLIGSKVLSKGFL